MTLLHATPARKFARRVLNAATLPRDALRFRNSRKVFCIGRNKTGTTSLEQLLRQFGFHMGPQAAGEKLMEDWGRGEFRRIIRLARFRGEAFQDLPFSLPGTYKALDAAFPEAKFILTVRDSPEQWYQSNLRYQTKLFGVDGNAPTKQDLQRATYVRPGAAWRIHELLYDPPENDLYNQAQMMDSYIQHNKEIQRHFADRPEQLLVVNVRDANAVSRIKAFLGVDSDVESMPWENRS